MKKVSLLVAMFFTFATAFSQAVNYDASGLMTSTTTAMIAESDSGLYVFQTIPGSKTLVVLNRNNGTQDTIGSIPFRVNATCIASTSLGEILWIAGEHFTGSSDTCFAGIVQASQSFWWPNAFPIGSIASMVNVSNGVLVGGAFSVTSPTTSQTYTNLAKFPTMIGLGWVSAATAYPNGTSKTISVMKEVDGSILIGLRPNSGEMNVSYVSLSQDGSVVDSMATTLVPSAVDQAWEIADFEVNAGGVLYAALTVYEFPTRGYVCSIIGATMDTIAGFSNASMVDLQAHGHKMWGILSSSQPALQSFRLFSLEDGAPQETPRFLNGTASSLKHLTETMAGNMLVCGAFSYVLQNGDTVRNSMAITVIDTTPPVIYLVGETDTVSVPKGTPVSFYYSNGVGAVDNFDGDITASIVGTGAIDSSTVGDYLVTYTVTDLAGYSDTVYRLVRVFGTTDINDQTVTFGMYPNPAHGQVTFTISEPAQLMLSDATGRSVGHYNLQSGTNHVTVANLPQGFYIATLATNDGLTISRKLSVN